MAINVENLKAGSLFAGIGGFDIGLKEAGIPTLWAVDNSEYAQMTYQHNIAGTNYILENIQGVTASDLEPVDILVAGFPCQSFSMAGARKGFEDDRGKLFYELTRIITEFKEKRPAVIFFENSPNLRVGENGTWFFNVIKEIRKAGYWFRSSNAEEIDVFDVTELPQKRNRLYLVGFATNIFNNGRFTFPTKKNRKKKDITKYIDFYSRQDDSYYLNEENRYCRMINDKFSNPLSIYQLRKFLVRVKNVNECPTLTANMGAGGHNVPFIFNNGNLRKLTEKECLNLQGFPEEYEFPDTVPKAQRYIQVGNAVCPKVIKLITEQIKLKINEVD